MQDITKFIKKVSRYGFQDFFEIVGELSSESVKKGNLSRLQKELITLGIAEYKKCHRCIEIHTAAATKLDATQNEFSLVRKVILFVQSPPNKDDFLMEDWVESWRHYSYSRINERQLLREFLALAVAIIKQREDLIRLHMLAAIEAGAKIEQIYEIIPIVLLMDGAPTLSQIPILVTCFDDYEKKNKN